MNPRKIAAFLAGTLLSIALPSPANPGHEVTIADLTAQIAQSPGIPELYFQRARNFVEIGRNAEARQDWQETLKLNPVFLPAFRELARLDDLEGNAPAGIARLRHALASAPPDQDFHRAGCYSLLAEMALRTGQNQQALADANAGIAAAASPTMDLAQAKSEAQRRLGMLNQRANDLASAMTGLHSFVIKIKWIEAMIDAGRGPEILPIVENEIATTRYQASWLIRRARIRQQSSDSQGAATDLSTAMAEINNRITPENRDLSLLCDRGLIQALSGNTASAQADLTRARQDGADFWMTLPLQALLEPPIPIPPPIPSQNLPQKNSPPVPKTTGKVPNP